MADPVLWLYRFFRIRRGWFFLLVIACCAVFGVLASRITFEEDISNTRSAKGAPDNAAGVLSRFKMSDKLVIMISLRDTLGPADPETLAQAGTALADSLAAGFDTSVIRSVTFRSSDATMSALTDLVEDHLPNFLDEEDYARLDTLCQPGAIERSMQTNYRILVSPAGMMMKERIRRDPIGITGRAFEKLKALNAGESYELRDGCIWSAGFRHLFLFIVPTRPASETAVNDRLISGLDRIIASLEEAGDSRIRIQYFGGAAVAVSNARQLKTDITLTLILAVVSIFLLIGWYYRSIRIPLLGFLPALFGGAFALALLYLVKGRLSVISLGIGSVILGMILDYSLYIVNHYRKTRDMETTLKQMSLTITLCCLTTSGAFLCLPFLSSAVLQDLGYFAALSVAGAALFTLVILPHLIGPSVAENTPARRLTLIDRIADYPIEKKRWTFAVVILLVLTAAVFSGKTAFERNMWTLSFMTPELTRAERDLDRISDYKLKSVYLIATGKTLEEALRRQEQQALQVKSLTREGWIRQHSNAGRLLLSDSIQEAGIRRWNKFWTPERKKTVLAAVARESGKLGFRPESFTPFEELLGSTYHPIRPGELPPDVKPITGDWFTESDGLAMTATILKVREQDRHTVYAGFRNTPGIVLIDRQTMTEQFISGVKQDFDLLVLLSMSFVSLLLIVSFGRIELGLITALPMFLSWLLTLGFMGLTGIRFNIFNIIISSFIFGLGVDYSILMTKGLLQGFRTGDMDMRPFKVSVLLSSLTTLLGVSALFFSRHPALNSIALISAVGIVAVVLLSFTIQPMVFHKLMQERQQQKKFPITARIVLKTLVTWGNIVLIAVILMILGGLIRFFLPLHKKKKEEMFHRIFRFLTRRYIAFTFFRDLRLINEPGEDFTRPAIIISNHQSLIETPAFLRLHPRMIILTSSWVFRSPVFGPIAHLADFYNTDEGLDKMVPTLRKKMEEGYSVLIFPEGHRSKDHHIQRFHRGAFYLAEQLKADILPMLVFGSGDFLGKGEFWGRPNGLRMKIMPRVTYDDPAFGATYQERTRQFRQYYIREYAAFRAREGTAHYYRRRVALNYVMKGPVLEWYMRVKLRLEKDYEIYNREMPRQGAILDLGCGYGFISYMLNMTGEDRSVTGVDFDAEKIAVASNGFARNDRIRFVCADITTYEITPHAGFVLGDVLHYLTPADQETLLRRCIMNLLPGGSILIREANAALEKRHRRSVLTEFFSTHSGFNKTGTPGKQLFFTTAGQLEALTSAFGLQCQLSDRKKITSNNLFIIRK